MAARTGVHVEGLRETVRRLEALGVDVQDLKDAFGAISRDVVTEAQALVPVDSGALRGAIRPAKTKNKAVVRAGTASRTPYAGVINYGWPSRGIPATGFLTTPANADPDGKVRAIEANLTDLIRRHNLT
jgi:Bacteriophage protein of unknown function (DUF646).